jgi:hypothetical protein
VQTGRLRRSSWGLLATEQAGFITGTNLRVDGRSVMTIGRLRSQIGIDTKSYEADPPATSSADPGHPSADLIDAFAVDLPLGLQAIPFD